MNSDIAAAAAILRHGGLVGMPTETVYGLAANALDAQAVLRIFAAKGRPRFDPLIVHCANLSQARSVAVFSPRAERLAAACWPGPLTLVLPRQACVPDVVTAGLDTVAVRVPDHPMALALIHAAGLPLAAPSANRFGRISPTTADAVREQLGDQIACILDGGPCRVGVESTVLRPDPTPIVLRPGGITRDQLATILDEPVELADSAARSDALPREAPGLLASHYAPIAPVELLAARAAWPTQPNVGLLAFTGATLPHGAGPSAILSPTGNLTQAAANLFACLRQLDALRPIRIVAELVPDSGLGEAINDRLRRAAGRG
ncbi:MAG: L-threonylcarbamoyladenylate synthase [Planctomycetota bacterium]